MNLVNAGKWMGRSFFTFIMSVGFVGAISAQSVYTVTSTDDAGAGSLRQAITDAEANPGADLIDATGISGTITLASALPTITSDVIITGPGANNLIISGNSTVRPFFITGGTVVISNLSIMNGLAQGGSPAVGGGGGAGMGGGAYIDAGTVTLTNVVFAGNAAKGGNSDGNGSFGYGSVGIGYQLIAET